MTENVSANSDLQPSDIEMAHQTRFLRKLALVGYFGLLIWVVLWHFALADNQQYSRFFWCYFGALFPMRGIIKGKPYTHAWGNFVVMIYFLHGLTAIYTEENGGMPPLNLFNNDVYRL